MLAKSWAQPDLSGSQAALLGSAFFSPETETEAASKLGALLPSTSAWCAVEQTVLFGGWLEGTVVCSAVS